MSQIKLIDNHVSEKQCKLAVDALLDHAVKVQNKKQETELLADKEQNVWLVVTVKQMHPEKKLKPHRMYEKTTFHLQNCKTDQMSFQTSRASYSGPAHVSCMPYH